MSLSRNADLEDLGTLTSPWMNEVKCPRGGYWRHEIEVDDLGTAGNKEFGECLTGKA